MASGLPQLGIAFKYPRYTDTLLPADGLDTSVQYRHNDDQFTITSGHVLHKRERAG
jgi:hypothetical protein